MQFHLDFAGKMWHYKTMQVILRLWDSSCAEESETQAEVTPGQPEGCWVGQQRILELFRLEKTLKSLSPAVNLTPPKPPLSHVPKHGVLSSSEESSGSRELLNLGDLVFTLAVSGEAARLLS